MGVASTEAILNNYVKLFQKARLEVTVRWGGAAQEEAGDTARASREGTKGETMDEAGNEE